jgi:hypothetical protein
MDDRPNLREFLNEVSSFQEDEAPTAPAKPAGPAPSAIGTVVEIAGSGSQIRMDAATVAALQSHKDPSVAMSGQVGSQIKTVVGSSWLIANVRTLKAGEAGELVAHVDFLGEGTRDSAGRMTNFRRGVTRYPIPGAEVLPVTTEDMRSIFAASDEPHIEIGTVYPTDDIRGALYVDPMLGKHFAVLGSTGTGKSTSVSLILHRISELSPEGHIVMIDPHGEYSAAFKGCGELFNVDNLQLPYWLMNFEEHCEVILTTHGAERQRDADILAKCLLAARTKGKDMSQYGKVTVDSPIPYLLTDLNTIIVNEMGKLDRAGDTIPFQRLKTKLEELRADPRYTFMFSGMMVSDSMAALSRSCSGCRARAVPSRSSTFPAFPPRSRRSWCRCSRGWCSTMRSGPGPRRSARCCWSAKKRTATSPRTRAPRPARPFARSSSASPRKAANMACRSASSPSVRRTLPRACCHSAERSSRCV